MADTHDSYKSIIETHLTVLADCRICPHQCGADRLAGKPGVCGSDASFNISSICIHMGEEPVIGGQSGICNIFFSRCNLACSYCQNWQISSRKGEVQEVKLTLEGITSKVVSYLDQGCKAVGFVSPSHNIPHVKAIIESLRLLGRNAVFVYNTNCYDLVEEIKGLENYIDVYLPDFKYADGAIAGDFSGARDYPEIAMKALKEMHRQKGSTLIMDNSGQLEKGLIIRHLIIPGNIENSKMALGMIAENLSESVSISLMSQYYPVPAVMNHSQLGRTLLPDEYESVIEELEKLGFYKGWVQELDSHAHYRPDFNCLHPFDQ